MRNSVVDAKSASQRQKSRRARIACLHCRRRKVRCSVESDGIPCVNCRLDNSECIAAPKGRSCNLVRSTIGNYYDDTPTTNLVLSPLSSMEDKHPTTNSEVLSEQYFKEGQDDYQNRKISSGATLLPFSYFRFLNAPNLWRLQPADMVYLESQKCLHVPAGSFLEVLLSHYFLYAHPCLPIINEAKFWNIFRKHKHKNSNYSFSLLVFQAMLFVASSYIPNRIAQENGARSVLEIRNSYYRRAKLLYDLGVEDDPLSLAQASVLLSFQSCKEDHLSNTKWLAVAIQHARAANAHLYYRYPDQGRDKRTDLKRIWWSVILRDRIIAIGMRRPIQVHPVHFDASSHDPLVLDDLEDEINESEVYDANTKRMLCTILTSQCRLATAVTMLITTIYPHSGVEDLQTDFCTKLKRTDDIKSRLQYWETHHMVRLLPDQDHYAAVDFYAQLTSLYYESARLAVMHNIYFYYYVQTRSHSHHPLLDQLKKENQIDMINVLTNINDKVEHFIVDGTAGHLPISVVAYTVAPQILLNLNMRLTDSNMERCRYKRFLNFYSELTQLYHLRYDVSQVTFWIEQILSLFDTSATPIVPDYQLCDSSMDQLSVSSCKSHSSGKNFAELLELRPSLYLQLVALMDYAMSTGSEVLVTSCFPISLPSIKKFPSVAPPITALSEALSVSQIDQQLTQAGTISEPEKDSNGIEWKETDSQKNHSFDDFLAYTTILSSLSPSSPSSFQENSADQDMDVDAVTTPHLVHSSIGPTNIVGFEQNSSASACNLSHGSPTLDSIWIDIALLGE